MEKQKENDGWFGPEVRPEDNQEIIAYFKGVFNGYDVLGQYIASLDSLLTIGSDDEESWSRVICWQPIQTGEIPDRFKKQD